jgi:hypothetical protein
MLNPVLDTPQRHYLTVRERHSVRQPTQPSGYPSPMTVCKRASLTQRSAWGHRKHNLATCRVDAQGIAARLPVTPHADGVDLAVEINRDRRRSPDAAI